VNSVEGWKTYINNEYHYELKYPPTWEFEERDSESPDYVSFTIPGREKEDQDPTGAIGIKADKRDIPVTTDDESILRFQSFMDSCSSQTPTQCTQKISDDYEFEKQITIDGKPAFQTYGGCCMAIGRHIFLYRDEYTFRFTLYNLGRNAPSLENEDVFDLILSTFEFRK
jgi:hypothetical protein